MSHRANVRAVHGCWMFVVCWLTGSGALACHSSSSSGSSVARPAGVPGSSAAEADAEQPPAQRLRQWLDAHPRVAAHLIFWQDSGEWLPYPHWSAKDKSALGAAFTRRWRGESLGLPNPPENRDVRTSAERNPVTILSEQDGRDLYFALVAQSLVVEIRSDVPWSITEYSEESLAVLLDGRQTLGRVEESFPLIGLWTVPAPPGYVADWLQRNSIVGANKRDTIANMLAWSQDHLLHFLGGYTVANLVDHWGYTSGPPVSRVLEPTKYRGNQIQWPVDTQHFTAGCHGTVALLRSVLRVVNIPVVYRNMREGVEVCEARHAQAYFPTEGLYLPHGDDPYGSLDTTPRFPAIELLVDEERWEELFGDDVPDAAACANLSRNAGELAERYLTDQMLRTRCDHPDSPAALYQMMRFTNHRELAERRLVERVDAKIEQFGGCDKIPKTRLERLMTPHRHRRGR